MKRTLVCLALLVSLVGFGCPPQTPDLSQSDRPPENSVNLTPAQLQDIPLMEGMLRQSGYIFRAALTDVDGNGRLDIFLTYVSGREAEPAEKKLSAVAGALGFAMAGCGYEIDKVYARLGEERYVALFSECRRCVWEPGEGEQQTCLKEIWKKAP